MANRAAIRALVRVIKRLEPEQCYMGDWIRRDEPGLPPPSKRAQAQCGTTACIAGWAALMLAPTTLGKTDSVEYDPLYVRADWARSHRLTELGWSQVTIGGRSYVRAHTSEIARKALGLTVMQAHRLFSGGSLREGEDDKTWMLRTLRERFLRRKKGTNAGRTRHVRRRVHGRA